jgi:alginate O-acetyltransferase complex protein AlgI
MLFNSITFAVFLPVVLALYWAVGLRRQNWILLAASYVFYGAWDPRFLSLIVVSTLVDFFAGKALGRTQVESRRRLLLLLSLTVNLGILGFFKYYGFFLDSALELLGWFGLRPNPPLLEVLLPVGISFYTFQTISYTFDVFRRRIEPAQDLIAFAAYVAFFPQLVAGPIERAKHLLPQIRSPRPRPSGERIRSGLFLMLLGLFKKVAVADAVAPIVDEAFAAGSSGGRATLLIGAIAFSLQIYGDFSGYTDIARGVSRLFGIELVRNFEQPYLSRSITEFWRTWHISLSAWLHDYLYVPLGGNKGGGFTTYRNLMLTMLLGGLWHGAAWTFVVWGGLHGLVLAIHRALGGYVPRGRPQPLSLRKVPSIVATFSLVTVLWVFFRADDLTAAFEYLRGLATAPWGTTDIDSVILVAYGAVLILIMDLAQRITGDHSAVLRWPAAAKGATVAMLFLGIVTWTGGSAQPFIYFQF